ncbi:MAG: ring-cleaving dioxygenase [Alkalibacterium sp.]
MKETLGIHHITAIVGHPQDNVDFYSHVLGLRLVKKTVNFDDPTTYHLYFGNKEARPGTIITFFPWSGAEQGEIGGGQVGITTYAVPAGSLDFWIARLTQKNVPFRKIIRFSETYIQFEDPHGLKLELVEREDGPQNSWSNEGVSPDVAIKGFGGAVLYSTAPTDTANTLTETLGLIPSEENEEFLRLTSAGDLGNVIDIKKEAMPLGHMGVGTVHHIAWRAHDETDHKEWHEYVTKRGHDVTDIKDRNYFKALYFREPGRILFEIASDTPGFAIDEEADHLGESLKLPEQYESKRKELEDQLIPLNY